MPDSPDDLQLRFTGDTVEQFHGAPAEAVIASLNALQRMAFILGTKATGRALGQRLKPSVLVRHVYAVICRVPIPGSHIQPFNIVSSLQTHVGEAAAARVRLLQTLEAFDSGKQEMLESVLPSARERWFMAGAVEGLLPTDSTGLQITIKSGSSEKISFSAERARILVAKYLSAPPPPPEVEAIDGLLHTIDYARTIITIKPDASRAVRIDYPDKIEGWLQINVRRLMRLSGDPRINNAGDITGFDRVVLLTELNWSLDPIIEFKSGTDTLVAKEPVEIFVSYDFEYDTFCIQDETLGIETVGSDYTKLRKSVLEDLDVLWQNYALAPSENLALDAIKAKDALNARFQSASKTPFENA